METRVFEIELGKSCHDRKQVFDDMKSPPECQWYYTRCTTLGQVTMN